MAELSSPKLQASVRMSGSLPQEVAVSKIEIDEGLASRLKAAAPGTVLTGPDGTPVGGIVPLPLLNELPDLMELRKRLLQQATEEVTLAELQAADAAGGEIPHEEVMKLLGLE
jgi:hypothetical protein